MRVWLKWINRKIVLPLLLRLGPATVFTLHGLRKVVAAPNLGTAWHPELHVVLQALVAWGELLGGVALLFGFLTRLAALGLISIMVGAIVLVTGRNGFYIQNGGFEYNFVLIVLCLAVMLTGPGIISLDRLLFPPREKSRSKVVQPKAKRSSRRQHRTLP